VNEPEAEVKNDRLRRVLTVGWVLALLSIVTVHGHVLSITRLVFLLGFTAALIGFALRQLLLRRRYGNSVPILRWMPPLAGSLALIGRLVVPGTGVAGLVVLASLVALLGLAIRDTVARMRARRKPPDRVVQVGVGLAVALFLVGGIQGPQRASAEADIKYTLDELATKPNPDYCETLMSARYLHQTYGGTVGASYWCLHSLDSRRPYAVNVFDVRVADDRATAKVTDRNGSFGGSTLKFALVKQRGYWKLDELLGFTSFNRAKFEAAYRKSLVTGRYRFPPAAAGCALATLRNYSTARLEELYLIGRAPAVAERSLLACDRRTFVKSLATSLTLRGNSSSGSIRDCLASALGETSNGQIMSLYREPTGLTELRLRCGRPAFLAEYHRALRTSANDYPETVVECTMFWLKRLPNHAIATAFLNLDPIQARIEACRR